MSAEFSVFVGRFIAQSSAVVTQYCHLITLSARASTFGGTPTILDFGFPILD
jgi:hypothetical protein